MSDTSTVRVGPKGRVVLPMSARRKFGIEVGTELIVIVGEHEIELMTRQEAIARLRDRFTDIDHDVVDELLSERRAEAQRDLAWRPAKSRSRQTPARRR